MNLLSIIIEYWSLIISFFAIAFLYSSVGFGGGSSYLAVLSLTALSYSEIRSTALLCNIIVVSSSFFMYYKKGFYIFKKVFPLIFASIPFAFIGGYLKTNQTIFFLLLGITLFFTGITMFISNKKTSRVYSKPRTNQLQNTAFGSGIGFLSGIVGIGGGIFLAPLLYLANWDTPKKIAATTSLFILVNSISGFTGQLLNPDFEINLRLSLLLLISCFIGGQLGTKISIRFFKPTTLKKGTAILILFVALKILWKYY